MVDRRLAGGLRDDLFGASTPILIMVAYAAIMLVPDQSAEAIRASFQNWSVGQLLVFVMWLLFLVYLGFAAGASVVAGLFRLDSSRNVTPSSEEARARLDKRRAIIEQTVAAAPFLITALAVIISLAPSLRGLLVVPASGWIFIGVCLLFGYVFARRPGSGFLRDPGPAKPLSSLSRRASLLLGSALIVAVVLGSLRLCSNLAGVVLDPPPVLLVTGWLVIALAVLEFFEWLTQQWGFPVLPALIVIATAFSWWDLTDNHQVRTVAAQPDIAGPQETGAAFDEWLQARQPELDRFKKAGRPYPVLLFAAEGGGARAAFTTALVLEQFRTACPDVLRHSFAVLGVSGGSVGATLASAAMQGKNGLGQGCSPTVAPTGPVTRATQAGGQDLLRPLLRGSLFADLPLHMLPSGIVNVPNALGLTGPWLGAAGWVTALSDRAQYLEHGIDVAWLAAAPAESPVQELDAMPFGALWSGPSGGRPALVLLTTDVDSGRRVAVSHIELPGLAANTSSGCPLLDRLDDSPASRARLLTLHQLAPSMIVSATTAAVLSARFPGLTPPGTVTCDGETHQLVDGGYFENTGLTTVTELLAEIRTKAEAAGAAITIVQIENSRATTDWRFANGQRPAPPSRSLSEWLSPVRAIAGTREARGDLARVALDRLVEASPKTCSSQSCLSLVRFELRPCRTPIPLGWSLSDDARDEIRRQLFSPDATGHEPACISGRPSAAPTPNAGRPNTELFATLAGMVMLP